jgi:hypothetical protein
MPTVKLSPIFNSQISDENGVPAVGWKVYSYAAGSSSPLATYTDSTGSIAQSNPIILNSLGFPTMGQIWLASGNAYKLVLTDENDVVKKTEDFISGVNDSSSATSEWGDSGFSPTYILASSFSLPGDQTSNFHLNRRLKFQTTAGTVYGRITASVFASSITTVTMQMDGSQVLDSGLSVVQYSILRNDVLSVPYRVATTTGVDTYVASVGIVRLVISDEYKIKIANPNLTASPTLNLDGTGAIAILDPSGFPLGAGALNGEHTFRYNGTSHIVLNPLNVAASPSTSRQTVLGGVVNSSGYPNMLSAGTGLALNLSTTAGAAPMRTAFSQGAVDFISTLSSDVTGVVTALSPNVLSYVTQDYVSSTSVTWGKTIAPPQYGVAYQRSAQSVLQFGGSAGSTTFLDDYGNTWTPNGGAKVQTNQFKFGTGALGGAGASNALNGTTDYIKTTDITSVGAAGWFMRLWFYGTNVAGSLQCILNCAQSSGVNFGIFIGVSSSKINYYLSSNGTSWDIASAVVGTLTVPANAQNFFEITYDPVAGKYYGFLNGLLDFTVTSSAKIITFTTVTVGGQLSNVAGLTGYIDKFEFQPYCQHPNATLYTVPVAASNVATQGYSSDFFSVPAMTMYQVSGASTAAGSNPVFTAKNRVYVAETTTGASTVSSVVNYAFRGYYDSGWFSVTIGTLYLKSNNLGISPSVRVLKFQAPTLPNFIGDVPGAVSDGTNIYGAYTGSNGPNTTQIRTAATYVSPIYWNTAAGVAAPYATGNYRLIEQRGW